MKNRAAATHGHDRKQTHRSNRRKRSFKRKVKNYLKADCFLYAPLVSRRPPSDLSPPAKSVDSSAAGLRRNETSRTQQKKKLLQRILEYLQSDFHMYGALIDAPEKAPASGLMPRFEKLTVAISRRITTVTRKPHVTNPTPDHVMEDTNRGEARQSRRYRLSPDSGISPRVSDGEARQSRRYRLSSDSGAMNRELRRLLT